VWEARPSREVRSGVAVRANGQAFDAEFTLSTLETEDTREHTIVLRDVSQRKETEALLRARTASLAETLEELRAVNEQLSERSRELERAMGTRSRFYAAMSHELRTPINAILGYSSLLMDGIFGPLNDNQKGSLERARLAAHHLLELVNDILDLSKIEAGKVELKLEPVAFPDLIEELLATVTPLADEHGVELQLESSPDRALSDPRRIRQILLNLLSNAIKFGERRPVRVTTGRGEGDCIVIEVRDHGPGIAAEDQERIFEEFVQLETENKPGTGLGLPISRRLAELLGGSLTVRSEPGQGSTFRLTIPPVHGEPSACAPELTAQATE
jgi:signal transduction histidine kinase